jgi:hypothetical protein
MRSSACVKIIHRAPVTILRAYVENSRLIRLHFELLQCEGRTTFCRSDGCLRQEYGLAGGHYRLLKSYYSRSTY